MSLDQDLPWNVLNNKQESIKKDNLVDTPTSLYKNSICLHTMQHVSVLEGHHQASIFKKNGS